MGGTRRRRIVTGVVIVCVAVGITAIVGGFSGSSPVVNAAEYTFAEGCTSADAEANVRVNLI